MIWATDTLRPGWMLLWGRPNCEPVEIPSGRTKLICMRAPNDKVLSSWQLSEVSELCMVGTKKAISEPLVEFPADNLAWSLHETGIKVLYETTRYFARYRSSNVIKCCSIARPIVRVARLDRLYLQWSCLFKMTGVKDWGSPTKAYHYTTVSFLPIVYDQLFRSKGTIANDFLLSEIELYALFFGILQGSDPHPVTQSSYFCDVGSVSKMTAHCSFLNLDLSVHFGWSLMWLKTALSNIAVWSNKKWNAVVWPDSMMDWGRRKPL